MKQVVKDIFIILHHPEKRKLWWLALADVCMSILDMLFLVSLLYIVNYFTQPARPFAGNGFITGLFNYHPILLIGLFFFLFAIKNYFGFRVAASQYRFVYNVASRISRENLRQYLEGPFQDYVNIDSSVVNRKINQQPIEFCHYVLNGVQQVFSQSALVLITSITVVLFNPLLFPLLILLLAPPVFFVSYLMKRKLAAGRLQGKQTSEKSLQHLQEALHGFVESNVYSRNDYFINRYHRLQAKLNYYLSQRLIIQNMPPRLIEIFAVFGLLVLVVVNFLTTNGHAIPLVTIGALMVAAYKMIPGIVKITNTAGLVKSYAFTAADLAVTTAIPLQINHHHPSLRRIEFKNVCFNYPGKPVLQSVSFAFEQRDFVVLPGLSGIGKTTLINLLLGFLTQDAGDIALNGIAANSNIRKLCQGRIAYAKQQAFFLHASVLENIVLQEGAYNESKMEQILAMTGLKELVNTFAGGLETLLTENGRNISGGQRQRIIFARALYKDFDLLILDEPFSELDEPSELAMLEELKKLAAAGKMILLITHNKNALNFCNKKIVLDECG